MSKNVRLGAAVLLVVAAPALAGCPSPNSYATPRTTPAGELSHTIAAEGVGVVTSGDNVFIPTIPTYQLRIGVVDSADIGVRVSNLSTFGAEVKWNPIRGPFDLALAPGFQAGYIGISDVNAFIGYTNVPLILGVNVNEWFSVVPTAGVSFVFASVDDASSTDAASTGSGVLGRGGLGFNFRVSKDFAIHPEVTALLNPDQDGVFFSYGVGFNLGALPNFDDMKQ